MIPKPERKKAKTPKMKREKSKKHKKEKRNLYKMHVLLQMVENKKQSREVKY